MINALLSAIGFVLLFIAVGIACYYLEKLVKTIIKCLTKQYENKHRRKHTKPPDERGTK